MIWPIKKRPDGCRVSCGAQQARVRDQFPDTATSQLALFPAPMRNPRGVKPFNRTTFTERFRTWVQDLPRLTGPGGDDYDRSDITPYSLRHSYAQRHADGGTPVEVLAELMGHTKLSTTQGVLLSQLVGWAPLQAVRSGTVDYPRVGGGQCLWCAAMHVYFMDVPRAGRPCSEAGLPGWPEAGEKATRLGFAQRRPFLLDDDGRYDVRLNSFFRACPTLGVHSMASQRAYARDLVAFARFLAASGKSLWDADKNDIDRYFEHRCGDSATRPLSLRSWNRAIAALKCFYLWAVEDGFVEKVPFRHKTIWVLPRSGGGRRPVQILAGTMKAGQSPPRITFLTWEQYNIFRSVGLLGRLPDGSEDPSWDGRNGARSAAFADFLVLSGARVAEGASFLLPELRPAEGETVKLRLAPRATKGDKGREVVVASRVVQAIHEYVKLERANTVQRSFGRPVPVDAVLARRKADGPARSVEVFRTGKWGSESLATMTVATRLRLFEVDSEGAPVGPLGVWLSERGTVAETAAWRGVFDRASARCRRFGFQVDATPHVLRHTFACHMLHHLFVAEGIVYPTKPGDARSFRSMVVNPVRTLQRLLGHAHIMTTYTYLDCVADLGVVEEAASTLYASMAQAAGE